MPCGGNCSVFVAVPSGVQVWGKYSDGVLPASVIKDKTEVPITQPLFLGNQHIVGADCTDSDGSYLNEYPREVFDLSAVSFAEDVRDAWKSATKTFSQRTSMDLRGTSFASTLSNKSYLDILKGDSIETNIDVSKVSLDSIREWGAKKSALVFRAGVL